ncbi:MAG: hypothetical protein ABSC22_11400 [Roseiarcus sp.]|jgi:hypothetical protein
MAWRAFDDGRTIGQLGSEVGVIMRDDEHDDGARITLERNGRHAPFAITCGVYGWMLHTRFLSHEAAAQRAFDEMRAALGRIVDAIPLVDDPEGDEKSQAAAAAMGAFAERYP